MFQFLRRVSGSFLPRPDRPWSDDATSHAPTIGRKRRHSVTEQDGDGSSSSSAKRTKNDPVKPDTECNSSGGESPKTDAPPPVEGQDVKEVTKGVKEVDLEDAHNLEDASIRPEGVPLPDSPSGSPEPEPESQEPEPAASDEIKETKEETKEETKDVEHADDEDSVASSAPEEDAEGEDDVESVTTNAEIAPAHELTIPVESVLHDTPDTVEVKA